MFRHALWPYIVVAYAVLAYIVMASIVMTDIFMAYMVIAGQEGNERGWKMEREAWKQTVTHLESQLQQAERMDTCTDVCTDMCADMCTDVRAAVRVESQCV